MAEGRLTKDKISESNIILQENVLSTTIVNAPLPPPTIPSTFSFLVSFEKFHVTAAYKAGYNKIYEFRRSKSFFFEVVDQIPDTNEIHLKIYTNDYHMSSTPIRGLDKQPYSRHNNTPLLVDNGIHHKSFHANLIYEKYINNSRQEVFSHRTGISYRTRYIAHELKSISPPNKIGGFMYKKTYEGFTQTLSSNARTAAKQKKRFDRSCRRVFNKDYTKSRQALRLRHKISLANRQKFLFYPYQKIYSRVNHLKFNRALFNTHPNVPLFRFPYDRNCALLHLPDDRKFPSRVHSLAVNTTVNKNLEEEDDSSSDSGADDSHENSYRDWYITNLIDEHYGQGASEYIDAITLIQDSTISLSLRDAYMLGLDQDRIYEIKARDRLNERSMVIQDIKDYNTSAKHYLRRMNGATFFTQMNDEFHERMDKIRRFAFGKDNKKSTNRRILSTKRLDELITNFSEKYRDEHYPFKPYRAIIQPDKVEYIKDDLGDTSDDTKILERRVNKRHARISHYYYNKDLSNLTKKVCLFDCRDTKEDYFLPANIDLFFKFRM
ncbi:hypothetical protein RhiirA4_474972 [Rhizophagus irregularis]|uniref:DUF8211 domain-containing protein n=1 Tax=Rhizophagus irregularis TaxID=588596 RepID=A0A2I1H9D1_9GLOM|nr:hypothetical protein RhiirA4_474972 [Rhizophagus irregularis]